MSFQFNFSTISRVTLSSGLCLNHPFLSDATVYVGGLDEKVSEPLLWELFLQAGPVVNTHMPKDRVTGQHQGKRLLLTCNKVNIHVFQSSPVL